MRILWTLVKIVIALAIVIPVGLLAMAMTLGIVGAVVGLAMMALRLAVLALCAYGVFRVARFFLAPSRKPAQPVQQLPSVDPYYAAAMRELDSELRQ